MEKFGPRRGELVATNKPAVITKPSLDATVPVEPDSWRGSTEGVWLTSIPAEGSASRAAAFVSADAKGRGAGSLANETPSKANSDALATRQEQRRRHEK